MPDYPYLISALDALASPPGSDEPDAKPLSPVVAFRVLCFVASGPDGGPPVTTGKLAETHGLSPAQMADVVQVLAGLRYAEAVPVFTDTGRPATAWTFQFDDHRQAAAVAEDLPKRPTVGDSTFVPADTGAVTINEPKPAA